MFVITKRHWAAMMGLVVGCLAFGSCFGDATQPYGTGFSELAMLVDDCADEYQICREECIGDASDGGQDGSGGPGYPGAGGGAGGLPGGEMHCFYPIDDSTGDPAATAEYVLEAYAGTQTVHVRLTFNPAFVDNTYGATAIGWNGDKGHKFKDLVGSDHAELALFDKSGSEKVHFKVDYISENASAPSGYATAGVLGGDGKMILGDASLIVGAMSSLDRNFNERGYGKYTVDSPATDANYTPNAAAPDWDFRVVYETWVKAGAFGSPGFGSVSMTFVHASPSKAADNTVEVEERPCPPEWTPGSESGEDTSNDTPGDDVPPLSDAAATESCLTECETVFGDCIEDVPCDPCLEGFGPCVDVCKVDFSICSDLDGPAECNPGFDACVKGCVTAVDECTKDAALQPEDWDSICEPEDTGGGVY